MRGSDFQRQPLKQPSPARMNNVRSSLRNIWPPQPSTPSGNEDSNPQSPSFRQTPVLRSCSSGLSPKHGGCPTTPPTRHVIEAEAVCRGRNSHQPSSECRNRGWDADLRSSLKQTTVSDPDLRAAFRQLTGSDADLKTAGVRAALRQAPGSDADLRTGLTPTSEQRPSRSDADLRSVFGLPPGPEDIRGAPRGTPGSRRNDPQFFRFPTREEDLHETKPVQRPAVEAVGKIRPGEITPPPPSCVDLAETPEPVDNLCAKFAALSPEASAEASRCNKSVGQHRKAVENPNTTAAQDRFRLVTPALGKDVDEVVALRSQVHSLLREREEWTLERQKLASNTSPPAADAHAEDNIQEVEQLHKQLDESRKEFERSEREREQLQTAHAKLQDNGVRRQQENDSLVEQVTDLKRKCADLEKERCRLEEEASLHNEMIVKLQATNEGQRVQLLKALSQMQMESSRCDSEIALVRFEAEELVATFRAQLSALEAQLTVQEEERERAVAARASAATM